MSLESPIIDVVSLSPVRSSNLFVFPSISCSSTAAMNLCESQARYSPLYSGPHSASSNASCIPATHSRTPPSPVPSLPVPFNSTGASITLPPFECYDPSYYESSLRLSHPQKLAEPNVHSFNSSCTSSPEPHEAIVGHQQTPTFQYQVYCSRCGVVLPYATVITLGNEKLCYSCLISPRTISPLPVIDVSSDEDKFSLASPYTEPSTGLHECDVNNNLQDEPCKANTSTTIKSDKDIKKKVCTNCSATETPLWRRSPDRQIICNACSLYYKLHGFPRPRQMWNTVVRKRMNRHSPQHAKKAKQTATIHWHGKMEIVSSKSASTFKNA